MLNPRHILTPVGVIIALYGFFLIDWCVPVHHWIHNPYFAQLWADCGTAIYVTTGTIWTFTAGATMVAIGFGLETQEASDAG